MNFPKIIGFDNASVRTERGTFRLDSIIYADGGVEKGGSPRFTVEDMDALRKEFLEHYAEISGSDLNIRIGTVLKGNNSQAVVVGRTDEHWIARSWRSKGSEEVTFPLDTPISKVLCYDINMDIRHQRKDTPWWWVNRIMEEGRG